MIRSGFAGSILLSDMDISDNEGVIISGTTVISGDCGILGVGSKDTSNPGGGPAGGFSTCGCDFGTTNPGGGPGGGIGFLLTGASADGISCDAGGGGPEGGFGVP